MKRIYPWLFILVTVGPAVANEFIVHPWLPYAANLLLLYTACLVLLLVLLPLTIIGPAKGREKIRKSPSSWAGWVALIAFALMGWSWLLGGQVACAVLTYIARHLDDEKPAEEQV